MAPPGPGPDPGPADEPTGLTDEPDAVEQVQRALLTLIGAARVALDAVEALIADRRRLDELAGSGRHLVDTLRSSVAGWSTSEPSPSREAEADPDGTGSVPNDPHEHNGSDQIP